MHRLKFKYKPDIVFTGIGIYAIVCIPTGKVYVGQTRTSFLNRWLAHQGALFHGKHSLYFLNAFKKYGVSNFECKVLEYLSEYDERLFNERETYWIRHYRTLLGNKGVFNTNDGGTGHNPTQERRKQMSLTMKRRMQIPSERVKVKYNFARFMSNPDNRSNYLRKRKEQANTPKERKARSERMSRYWKDETKRQEMSEKQKEHYATHPERRKKQSKSQKQSWAIPDIRERRIEGLRKAAQKRIKPKIKKTVSEEERLARKAKGDTKREAKLSVIRQTPEYKEKQRISQKKRLENPDELKKLLDGQKKAAENRKTKNDIIRTFVDAILYFYYIDNPKSRKLPLIRKLDLIKHLSSEQHWFITVV